MRFAMIFIILLSALPFSRAVPALQPSELGSRGAKLYLQGFQPAFQKLKQASILAHASLKSDLPDLNDSADHKATFGFYRTRIKSDALWIWNSIEILVSMLDTLRSGYRSADRDLLVEMELKSAQRLYRKRKKSQYCLIVTIRHSHRKYSRIFKEIEAPDLEKAHRLFMVGIDRVIQQFYGQSKFGSPTCTHTSGTSLPNLIWRPRL